uniref:Acetyl-coenzyme A carboxylase carboxyl transferase subunit beta, chloroplastic n=1 Tax=Passiflora malacophylla TaxID=1670793 RepID=A0A8E7MGD1_9ROSI|nr:acetyl-CoA carboxylase carboxyltransferase beta subunit [Passiflora malacophylla]
MANLNNKILWTPCCSNRDPDPLENENQNDIEPENPASEITNDPFFLSMLDSCFVRYFNFGFRKSVINSFIDSIIDDFLDDLIASSSANQKNGSIDPNHNSDNHNGESEEPSTNDNSDDHKGENEDPSTNDNSDTHNGESEDPSTSGNSDESGSQNGRPSQNTNEDADANGSPNASPLRIWVWSSIDANSDDRPNPNGSHNRFVDNVSLFGNDNSDDSGSQNGSLFGSQNGSLFGTSTNDNSDDHKGENEEPSTNDNSDDHKGENEDPSTNDNSDTHNGESEDLSTNDNSDDHKGENEDPSTNERKTIDYSVFWVQCETCYGINYKRFFFKSRLNICEHCGCHLRMDSPERIELSIDPGTWDPMDEAGKEDSIDPGTRDPMDEAGKEDEDMSVLDPIEWDWDPESEDDENEEDSDDEWDLDSDLYSYSDPDPNTDPEEKEESEEEESDPEEESEKDESEKEESDPDEEHPDEEHPEESDPDEEHPEESEEEESDPEEESEKDESDEEESEEEESEEKESDPEEEEWDEEESDEEEWDPWDRDEWNPWDPEEQEQKKKKEDPEEEEDWSWLEIEEEEVEVEDKPYLERIFACQDETELSEAVQTGIGQINGIPVAIGVMDFRFIGGSMGSVVGEKITRLIEYATNQILPLILVCASGGARMYEGSLSLMQMAKISAALYDYKSNKKSFYISILTTPTTGGVTASFGMLGDIIISEPDAYIAFAGKRVIEQTLNIEVPEGSQTAEVLFENGLLDPIVPRNPLKGVLDELLQLHNFCPLNKKE